MNDAIKKLMEECKWIKSADKEALEWFESTEDLIEEAYTSSKGYSDLSKKVGKIRKKINSSLFRFKLIFYKSMNDYTRWAAKLEVYQTPYEDEPLLYDLLPTLPKKTQKNYREIVKIFTPFFEESIKDARWDFSIVMNYFQGKVKLDKEFEEKIKKLPEMDGYYLICKPYLKNNKLTPKFKELLEKSTSALTDIHGISNEFYLAYEKGFEFSL